MHFIEDSAILALIPQNLENDGIHSEIILRNRDIHNFKRQYHLKRQQISLNNYRHNDYTFPR